LADLCDNLPTMSLEAQGELLLTTNIELGVELALLVPMQQQLRAEGDEIPEIGSLFMVVYRDDAPD
jgi:hypothetical protein